jgi:hypothetical protein
MLQLSVLALAVLLTQANGQGASQADMARTMESTCTGFCHGPSLIAQQRLDRNGWTREVDKMTRWGANVQPADRDALITYLSRTFSNNRPLPNSGKSVPAGNASDLFQTYCLSCHDDSLIISRKLDKGSWTGTVDRMIRWGAYVPAGRKDELVDYLTTQWGK